MGQSIRIPSGSASSRVPPPCRCSSAKALKAGQRSIPATVLPLSAATGVTGLTRCCRSRIGTISTFLLCVPGENKPVAFAFVTVIVERENKRNKDTGGSQAQRKEMKEQRAGGWCKRRQVYARSSSPLIGCFVQQHCVDLGLSQG